MSGQIVDRFKKNNEQKIRDNNGEIETRLRLETLLLAVNIVMQAR